MNASRKNVDVNVEGLRNGDVIKAFASPQENSLALDYKSLRQPIPIVALRRRHTRTREFVTSETGVEKGFPLGTSYRVSREKSAEEIEAAADAMAQEAVAQIRRAIQDPGSSLRKAKEAFIEALQVTYAYEPSRAIGWQAPNLAIGEAFTHCWTYVEKYLVHLAKESGTTVGATTDEQVLTALAGAAREATRELLSGDRSRSTNPYANAIDEDKRAGKAEWLRDHRVAWALHVAKDRYSITPDTVSS